MNENKHPIQGVMETAMQNIKEMVDVNTIIGDPIPTSDGPTIIPATKVNFGFASGGSDFSTKAHQPPNKPENICFGGGSGAGVTINPIAFLVISAKGVSLLPIDQGTPSAIDKVVDAMPDIIEKIKSFFPQKEEEQEDYYEE